MGNAPVLQSVAKPYARSLAESLKASGAARSEAICAGFTNTLRHTFVSEFYVSGRPGEWELVDAETLGIEAYLEAVYSDVPLVVAVSGRIATSSTSKPSLMATMLELLELEDGHASMEIGTGTGYNAAIMASLVGARGMVRSLEIDPILASHARDALQASGIANVDVVTEDGTSQDSAHKSIDRLVATVACENIPAGWLELLAADGRGVIPLEHGGMQPLMVVRPAEDCFKGLASSANHFVGAQGGLRGRRWTQGIVRGDAVDHSQSWPGYKNEAASDFWFYLSVLDARVTSAFVDGKFGFGLSDYAKGWAVVLPDGLATTGDSGLLRDLHSYYQDWCDLGQPSLDRYSSYFYPANTGPVAAQCRIGVINRGAYDQHVCLS